MNASIIFASRGSSTVLGADETCDHAATVDVADEDDGHVCFARKAHVGDVVRAQVDLGRRSGALDQDDIGVLADAGEAVEHHRHQVLLHLLKGCGLGIAVHAALHHDLRPVLALRL